MVILLRLFRIKKLNYASLAQIFSIYSKICVTYSSFQAK